MSASDVDDVCPSTIPKTILAPAKKIGGIEYGRMFEDLKL